MVAFFSLASPGHQAPSGVQGTHKVSLGWAFQRIDYPSFGFVVRLMRFEVKEFGDLISIILDLQR